MPGQGDLARLGRDAEGSFFRDAFDGFGDLAGTVGSIIGFLLLDVEIFRVFAHDDEVDLFGGGGDGFHGADVGVEVELFAEGDDGGGVAGDLVCGGGDGAEEGGGAFGAEGLDGFGG